MEVNSDNVGGGFCQLPAFDETPANGLHTCVVGQEVLIFNPVRIKWGQSFYIFVINKPFPVSVRDDDFFFPCTWSLLTVINSTPYL